jgi:thiosulfate dehydrogenase
MLNSRNTPARFPDRIAVLGWVLLATLGVAGCSPDPLSPSLGKLPGPLISSKTTMVTAWEFPNDPLTDPTLGNSRTADQIRRGFRIFTNTAVEAEGLMHGQMSCNNCHMNGGQRELSLPLVGVAAMFPEFNRRADRLFSLEDRIVGCFYRSQNATGIIEPTLTGSANPDDHAEMLPGPDSPEVLALSAYLRWLSRGFEPGVAAPWRRKNVIDPANRIPVEDLDPARGEELFMEHCTNCHGEEGQGVQIGTKKAGPQWGPDSWNDGAGAARIYTLAGIIRYSMPYLDPGRLTDEEAQLLARFINSKERPSYPFKDQDYLAVELPVDSVYYPKP